MPTRATTNTFTTSSTCCRFLPLLRFCSPVLTKSWLKFKISLLPGKKCQSSCHTSADRSLEGEIPKKWSRVYERDMLLQRLSTKSLLCGKMLTKVRVHVTSTDPCSLFVQRGTKPHKSAQRSMLSKRRSASWRKYVPNRTTITRRPSVDILSSGQRECRPPVTREGRPREREEESGRRGGWEGEGQRPEMQDDWQLRARVGASQRQRG